MSRTNFCHLTKVQREIYKAYLKSKQCQDILQGGTQVFVGLINLRKICNHPDLYTDWSQYQSEYDENHDDDDVMLHYEQSEDNENQPHEKGDSKNILRSIGEVQVSILMELEDLKVIQK